MPTGPREPRSTSLTIEQAAIAVAFRKQTLLPLDDDRAWSGQEWPDQRPLMVGQLA